MRKKIDFATAKETMADCACTRRVEIKKAKGIRQVNTLAAESEAQATKVVNEPIDKFFTGNAQLPRKVEAVEKSLANNAKIDIPAGTELVNAIGELSGVLTLEPEAKKDIDGHAASRSSIAAGQSAEEAI